MEGFSYEEAEEDPLPTSFNPVTVGGKYSIIRTGGRVVSTGTGSAAIKLWYWGSGK
jgi:hypothetical protein